MTMSFRKNSFVECIEQDEGLRALRAEYAEKPAEQRRMAADWEYHSSIAGRVFNDALARVGQEGLPGPDWPDGVVALAIDPLFAPAILTVGSIEYQLGRRQGAMHLFLQLTKLPPDEPDLAVIIDKAGDFLLDEEDYENARDLYAAAEAAFPDVAVYPVGLGYCLGKLGNHDAAVAKARRALELEPDNQKHLSDLGWSLYEAGELKEAEGILERAIAPAPEDYDLARGNLEALREALSLQDGDGAAVTMDRRNEK